VFDSMRTCFFVLGDGASSSPVTRLLPIHRRTHEDKAAYTGATIPRHLGHAVIGGDKGSLRDGRRRRGVLCNGCAERVSG
jgi:hypothetical protein